MGLFAWQIDGTVGVNLNALARDVWSIPDRAISGRNAGVLCFGFEILLDATLHVRLCFVRSLF